MNPDLATTTEITRLITHCTTTDPNSSLTATELLEAWTAWDGKQIGYLSARRISQELRFRGYPQSKSNGRRVFRGLTLKETTD